MTGHRVSESPVNARIDPILFARGMAVLRIFFGPILFANGLAKLDPALGRIDAKPFYTNLVTREGARGILNFEVNDRQIPKDAPTLRPARPAVSNPQAMSIGSESLSLLRCVNPDMQYLLRKLQIPSRLRPEFRQPVGTLCGRVPEETDHLWTPRGTRTQRTSQR